MSLTQAIMAVKILLPSNRLSEHLLRGVIGIAALWYAIHIVDQYPWLSLALGVLALIEFLGCPICWTMGLIETIHRRITRKSSDDSFTTQ